MTASAELPSAADARAELSRADGAWTDSPAPTQPRAEPSLPGSARRGPLGPRWRSERELAQEAALPTGRTLISCPAPFGVGGLGRHLQEIAATLERRGQPRNCICESTDAAPTDIEPTGAEPDVESTDVASPTRPRRLRPRSPLRPPGVAPWSMVVPGPLARLSPAWRVWNTSIRFDTRAASSLSAADHLIAFNGTALAQLEAARRAGFQSCSLVAANSHMRRVVRQHARAHRQYPLERPWATRILARNLREYARVDRIYVASAYIWESFVQEGVPERLLTRFPLTPAPRYEPASHAPAAATFDVVYVGSLAVHKGVPLLVDAIGRLPYDDLRLVLVGGWRTRGMRRFIERACARDPRIEVCPGDPLPHLRRARLCVHPTYEDGFAYAPAEALACGVPVLVSEDTGMKELVEPGRTGALVPTGDLDALTEALRAAYRGELCA